MFFYYEPSLYAYALEVLDIKQRQKFEFGMCVFRGGRRYTYFTNGKELKTWKGIQWEDRAPKGFVSTQSTSQITLKEGSEWGFCEYISEYGDKHIPNKIYYREEDRLDTGGTARWLQTKSAGISKILNKLAIRRNHFSPKVPLSNTEWAELGYYSISEEDSIHAVEKCKSQGSGFKSIEEAERSGFQINNYSVNGWNETLCITSATLTKEWKGLKAGTRIRYEADGVSVKGIDVSLINDFNYDIEKDEIKVKERDFSLLRFEDNLALINGRNAFGEVNSFISLNKSKTRHGLNSLTEYKVWRGDGTFFLGYLKSAWERRQLLKDYNAEQERKRDALIKKIGFLPYSWENITREQLEAHLKIVKIVEDEKLVMIESMSASKKLAPIWGVISEKVCSVSIFDPITRKSFIKDYTVSEIFGIPGVLKELRNSNFWDLFKELTCNSKLQAQILSEDF